jgi:hypothetical protein
MRRVLMILVPLALLLLAGCPSLSTLQTVSTVPKGKTRFAVGAEVIGYKEKSGSVTAPQTEFGVRYGVTDDIDVGAKIYFLGAEFGGKYQFLRGALDASVAPAVSYISITSGSGSDESKVSVAYIHLPILLGYNVSDSLTLGFGPKVLYTIATGSATSGTDTSSATASGFMAGGFVQIALKVGGAFWLAPELNIYKPFAEGAEGVLFQGGLGMFFGGAPNSTPQGQPMGQPMAPPGMAAPQ